MVDQRYRRRVARTVIELSKDDPQLVKEVIAQLRKKGEIEEGDLAYLERLADKWIRVAQENRQKGRR
jgi:hypothetical protein